MLPSSREGIAAFEKALVDSCTLLRPPEHLSLSQWSDSYAVLSPEGASQPGKWFTSNAEYQREPMDALTAPQYETVVLKWSSQVGKTQIGLNWYGFIAAHDPGPLLVVEPTEDLAKVIVRDRIEPMIRDTPALRAPFATKRGKPDMFHKPFPGGQLSFGWANSPSQVASRPIRYLHTDEEGRMQANAEGDPVDQAVRRMATFHNRKHLRTSSPALARTCRITKAYADSDQRRYFVPCPQCGHFQVLEFQHLKGTGDDVYYVCEANGCAITEEDKYAMVRQGEWRAQNPGGGDGKTAGFQLSALYSTIGYKWSSLMAAYDKCQGIPDKLQVFQNTVLGEEWDEQAEGADLHAIQARAEEYPAEAPAWAVLITCGADVQKDRIEATKWAWGLNDVSGVIEHRVFRGDVLKNPTVWADFDAWLLQRTQHETGLSLRTECCFIDSGDGNRTQAVYEFTRRREHRRIYASKGSSHPGAPLVNRGNRLGQYRTLVVSVGTSTAKDTIYGRLAISDPAAPGYQHFPSNPEAGCDTAFYQHLTAEKLVTRATKGGDVSEWINPPHSRNEALDCAVYALAAKEFLRPPLKELARRLAEKAAKLPPEAKPGGIVHALAQAARAVRSSLPGSAPASPSPSANPPKAKRRIMRPGSGWIYGG